MGGGIARLSTGLSIWTQLTQLGPWVPAVRYGGVAPLREPIAFYFLVTRKLLSEPHTQR